MNIDRYVRRLAESYRRNKKTFTFLVILRIMVLLTMIRCLVTQNYESAATCILVLLLFLVPAFLEDVMDMTIPPLFQAIIFAFIFAAEILGEIDTLVGRWAQEREAGEGFGDFTVRSGIIRPVLDPARDFWE